MWQIIATLFATTLSSPTTPRSNHTMFSKEQIIFSSTFNITKILVQADGDRYVHEESSDLPSVFFTVSDPKLEGGACVYVLEDLAAYEILEGGRDSTADYSTEKTVYIGAHDGIYKYDAASFSAKKLGPFRDDIIQLQKANGSEKIYILRADGQLFALEHNGTIRTKVQYVTCATQFVLDTSNNIYFVQCGDNTIHIVRADGSKLDLAPSVMDDLINVKLIRPAFTMTESIPFLADGMFYILYANGTYEKRDLNIVEQPSAFSVDAALYLVTALNGKIYEFNVMELMLQSMFGIGSSAPKDMVKLIMTVMDSTKDGIFGVYKHWISK